MLMIFFIKSHSNKVVARGAVQVWKLLARADGESVAGSTGSPGLWSKVPTVLNNSVELLALCWVSEWY